MVETDKYIEVTNRHVVSAKQPGEAQIHIRGDNGKPFISALYNVFLSRLVWSIIFYYYVNEFGT